MGELKPCPFCGGDAEYIEGAVAFFDVEVCCVDCGFSGPNYGSFDEPNAKEDATAHWNTRFDASKDGVE